MDDLDDVNSDDVAELLVDIRRELDRTETEFGASIDAAAVLDEYLPPNDDDGGGGGPPSSSLRGWADRLREYAILGLALSAEERSAAATAAGGARDVGSGSGSVPPNNDVRGDDGPSSSSSRGKDFRSDLASFLRSVPERAAIRRGGGIGPGKDVIGHHGLPSELASVYRQ